MRKEIGVTQQHPVKENDVVDLHGVEHGEKPHKEVQEAEAGEPDLVAALLAAGSEILWVCGEGFAEGLAPDEETEQVLQLELENGGTTHEHE